MRLTSQKNSQLSCLVISCLTGPAWLIYQTTLPIVNVALRRLDLIFASTNLLTT